MNKPTIALPLLLSLSGCLEAQNPKDIAQQYWQAMVNGDTEAARQYVSQDSQQAFEQTLTRIDQGMKIDQVALDELNTSVVTTINPDADKPYLDQPFETVLVLEQGKWKIDMQRTRIPPAPGELEKQLGELSQKLNRSLDQSSREMEQVFGESMRLLDELLTQGTKEMSESLLKGMEKFREAMRESAEAMRQRREQQQQQQQSQTSSPANDSGEGVI